MLFSLILFLTDSKILGSDIFTNYLFSSSFFFFFLLIIIIIIFEPIFNLLNHILFKSSKKKRVKVVIKSQIFMSKEIK